MEFSKFFLKSTWNTGECYRLFLMREKALFEQVRLRRSFLNNDSLEDEAFNVYIYMCLLVKSVYKQAFKAPSMESGNALCSSILFFQRMGLLVGWKHHNWAFLAAACAQWQHKTLRPVVNSKEVVASLFALTRRTGPVLEKNLIEFDLIARYVQMQFNQSAKFFVFERPPLPCFATHREQYPQLASLNLSREINMSIEKIASAVMVDLYSLGLALVLKSKLLAACAVYWAAAMLSFVPSGSDFADRVESTPDCLLYSLGCSILERIILRPKAPIIEKTASEDSKLLLQTIITCYSESQIDFNALSWVMQQLVTYYSFMMTKFDPVRGCEMMNDLSGSPDLAPQNASRSVASSEFPMFDDSTEPAPEVTMTSADLMSLPYLQRGRSGATISSRIPLAHAPANEAYSGDSYISRRPPFPSSVSNSQASTQQVFSGPTSELTLMDQLVTEQEIRSMELQILQEEAYRNAPPNDFGSNTFKKSFF